MYRILSYGLYRIVFHLGGNYNSSQIIFIKNKFFSWALNHKFHWRFNVYFFSFLMVKNQDMPNLGIVEPRCVFFVKVDHIPPIFNLFPLRYSLRCLSCHFPSCFLGLLLSWVQKILNLLRNLINFMRLIVWNFIFILILIIEALFYLGFVIASQFLKFLFFKATCWLWVEKDQLAILLL